MKLYAAIRTRGTLNVTAKVSDTMKFLNITKSNYCSLVHEKQYGMLKRAKDQITWGEINKDILLKLLKKRARTAGDRPLTEEYLKIRKLSFDELAEKLLKGEMTLKDAGIKPFFRLHPPKKGFERGGIKRTFTTGGVLGYRGEKINQLIEKMI